METDRVADDASVLIREPTAGKDGLRLVRTDGALTLQQLNAIEADEQFPEDSNSLLVANIPIPADFVPFAAKAFEVLARDVDPKSPRGIDLLSSAFHESTFTDTHLDTIRRAYEAGYYNVPRDVSGVELAAEFGISDQTLSERFRRAHAKLVEQALACHSLDQALVEQLFDDLAAASTDCSNRNPEAAAVKISRTQRKLQMVLGRTE